MLTFMTDIQKLKRIGHIRTCTRTNKHTKELNIQHTKRKTDGTKYCNKLFNRSQCNMLLIIQNICVHNKTHNIPMLL
jgi:uncharacterized protein (UPF0276 family)